VQPSHPRGNPHQGQQEDGFPASQEVEGERVESMPDADKEKLVQPSLWERYQRARTIAYKQSPWNWRHALVLLAGYAPIWTGCLLLRLQPSIPAVLMALWTTIVLYVLPIKPRK
jgi:hypothetical protein